MWLCICIAPPDIDHQHESAEGAKRYTTINVQERCLTLPTLVHTCPEHQVSRLLPSPSHPLTSFPPFFSALVTIMPVISIATSRALCLHSSHVQHRCTGRTRCVFLRRSGATGLPATVEPLCPGQLKPAHPHLRNPDTLSLSVFPTRVHHHTLKLTTA